MNTMSGINELIFKIEYFSCLVEFLLCTYFCSAFMEASKKKKYTTITILMAFVLAAIANILFFAYRNHFIYAYKQRILFLMLCVIVQWIYFHRNYFLSVVATIIYGEVTMVVDLVVDFVLMNVTLLPYKEQIAFLLYRIMAITILVLVLQDLVPKNTISSVYLLVACLFTSVLILCNWLMAGTEGQIVLPKETVEFFMQFLFIIFFLLQIVLVFFVLKIGETHQQKQTNALIELNNKMLKKSLDETEQSFELWRQSVHDYKNHVIVLRQMAEEERLDEIKAYLKQESITINKQLFMVKTGNSVADTIINIKQSLAEKHQIACMVHAKLPKMLVVADMDLANILGNLLDNAIEASQKEEAPYIDLTMKQEKNFFILNIRNKCTQVMGREFGKTSKENPEFHGIGLKSVKQTVKKYDGEINIEQTNQEYIVSIMIQNKQEN